MRNMNNSSVDCRFFMFMLVLGLPLILVSNPISSNENEEFIEAKNDLNLAIEDRNFKLAKDVIQNLFPLMEDEVKKNKKSLSKLRKEGSEEEVSAYRESLDRKTELVKSMKHLVDASPAALRAKAPSVLKMVQEFGELMD